VNINLSISGGKVKGRNYFTKQEVNVKEMYFILEMTQLIFGGLNINNK
jgi:hypothetical protein